MARFSVTILAAAVLASVLFLACGHESPAVPSVSPTGSTCTAFTLAGVQETFGGNGGSASVTITGVPAGCGGTWSASSSASWVTVTVDLLVSGSGRVTYQVAANPGAERTGALTVAGQSIVVKQRAAPVIVTPGEVTFNYSGSAQTWVVPAGITTIDVDAYGAAGGAEQDTNGGSPGGRVQTTLRVSPGQTLYVYVGGAGTSRAGGFNGGGVVRDTYRPSMGGGGGASDIRIGGTGLENRVVVAGGGGGGGRDHSGAWYGGPGGGLTAAGGREACSLGFGNGAPADGGSQSAGGAAGGCSEGGAPNSWGGSKGSLGLGGTGSYGSEKYGYTPGGGGGGGYYGGGGGGGAGGGGGGSSYSAGTNTVHTPGVRSGDGLVVITIK